MLKIVAVNIITDEGNQTTTVGKPFDITVLVIENNWLEIKKMKGCEFAWQLKPQIII